MNGYFDYDTVRFYLTNESVLIQNYPTYSEEMNSYLYTFREINDDDLNYLGLSKIEMEYDEENDIYTIKLYHIYNEIKCTRITGYSDSKLELLRRKEITTDELGNELPGYFNIVDIDRKDKNSIYNVPYDGCLLELLYVPGEVYNLKHIYDNLYVGDMIESIRLYYMDINGNPLLDPDNNPFEVYYDGKNVQDIYDLDYAITEAEMEDEKGALMCEIVSYRGATLENDLGTYILPDEEQYDRGVKYVDTLFVSLETGMYFLSDGNSFTFRYYLLEKPIKDIYVSDFRANKISDVSYFEFEPWTYYIDKENDDALTQTNGDKYTEEKHWEKHMLLLCSDKSLIWQHHLTKM